MINHKALEAEGVCNRVKKLISCPTINKLEVEGDLLKFNANLIY
jgi:hypothetical protein